MRKLHLIAAAAALLLAGLIPASAQTTPLAAAQPAAAQPYKTVAIVPAKPVDEPDFETLRTQVAEAAKRKDRAALAKLVVARGLFWDRGNRNTNDKNKSGFDNLAAALGLNNKDSAGWDILASYAEDPVASPSPTHKGAICAPANPSYDAKEFDELLKTTQTDMSEWGYPMSAGIEVHADAQANAPVIDKLSPAFVRVMPEPHPMSAAYLRIVTPAGKTGFVSVDAIAPIGNDQICYVKDGGAWKIGGYIGGGEP